MASNVACVFFAAITCESLVGPTASDKVGWSDSLATFNAVVVKHTLVLFFDKSCGVMALSVFVADCAYFLFALWAFAF